MAIVVKAGPQDNTDQVIRKFKKKVLQNDLINKIKDREFFKKPSLIKKEKLSEKRRQRKRAKRIQN